MTKTIIVTGGAGFIGSHLCERLVNRGDSVICLDNLLTGSQKNIGHLMSKTSFFFFNHDVTKPFISRRFARIDEIYHLASPADPNVNSPFSYMAYPFETMKVNTAGTWNMCELALKFGAKLSFASTSEIYGHQTEVPFKEEFTPRPISPYSITKYSGELYARMKYHQEKYPIIVLRPFNNFGPYQSEKAVIPEIIINCLLGREIKSTEGKQTREFNYVENITDGFVLAGEKNKAIGEIINLGSGQDISIKELILKIHQLTDSNSKLSIGSLSYRPTEIWKMFCENKKAEEILGWEPKISFEKGLKRTIEWYKRYIELYYNKNSGLPELSALKMDDD